MTEEKQVCRWAEETARKICGKMAWVRERNAEKLPYLAVRVLLNTQNVILSLVGRA